MPYIILFCLSFCCFVEAFELQSYLTTNASADFQNYLWSGDTLWNVSDGGLFWYDTSADVSGQYMPPQLTYSVALGVEKQTDGTIFVLSQMAEDPRMTQLQYLDSQNQLQDSSLDGSFLFDIQFEIDHAGNFWIQKYDSLVVFSPQGQKKAFSFYRGSNLDPLISDLDSAGVWALTNDSLFCRYTFAKGPASCFGIEDTIKTLLFPISMAAGPGGTLYVLVLGSNLYQLDRDNGKLKFWRNVGQTSGFWVARVIAVSHDGNIFIGYTNGDLARLDPKGTLTKLTQADGWISCLSVDAYGQPWFSTPSGLWVYENDTLLLKRKSISLTTRGKGMYADQNGILWSGDSYFDGNDWTTVDSFYAFSSVLTDGDIITYSPNQNPKRFAFATKKLSAYPQSVLELSAFNDSLAFGQKSGISLDDSCFAVRGESWTPFPLAGELSCWDVRYPIPLRDGRVASHTLFDQGKMYLYENHKGWDSLSLNINRRGVLKLQDTSGAFWFSSGDSLFRDHENQTENIIFPEPQWMSDNNNSYYAKKWSIHDVVMDSSGVIWVSTSWGLYYSEGDVWKYLGFQDGVTYPSVDLYVDPHGDIWGSHGQAFHFFRIKSSFSDAFYDTLNLPENYPFATPSSSSNAGSSSSQSGVSSSSNVSTSLVEKNRLHSTKRISPNYTIEYWYRPNGRKSREWQRYAPLYAPAEQNSKTNHE